MIFILYARINIFSKRKNDKVKKQIFIDMENYQTHFMKNRTADDRIKQNKKPILHVYKLIRFI